MTRAEFLARCGTVYDMGLTAEEQLLLLDRWIDLVLRLEYCLFDQGDQIHYVWQSLEAERKRIGERGNTLANDEAGYNLVRMAAVLSHPCQECATDPNAWHTRTAFCSHREKL